jgi:hypothetical protein
MVIIEFYGLARHLAKRVDLHVEASTVEEALQQAANQCAGLTGLITEGRLNPQYLASIDGERFVRDVREKLVEGERLLLLGADAGG